MNKLEKLFTIADIAEMTSLSDRSIRNYLRNGLLTGQKVGGQWRFTSQDIMNFFHRSDVSASVTKQWKLDILDFIDGVNPASEGERQACTVVDLYLSREEADACHAGDDHGVASVACAQLANLTGIDTEESDIGVALQQFGSISVHILVDVYLADVLALELVKLPQSPDAHAQNQNQEYFQNQDSNHPFFPFRPFALP